MTLRQAGLCPPTTCRLGTCKKSETLIKNVISPAIRLQHCCGVISWAGLVLNSWKQLRGLLLRGEALGWWNWVNRHWSLAVVPCMIVIWFVKPTIWCLPDIVILVGTQSGCLLHLWMMEILECCMSWNFLSSRHRKVAWCLSKSSILVQGGAFYGHMYSPFAVKSQLVGHRIVNAACGSHGSQHFDCMQW